MAKEGTGMKISIFTHVLVPPIFLVFFTLAAQILVSLGDPTRSFQWYFIGNEFSWSFCGILIVWAFLWLHLPGKTFLGPPTPSGFRPLYKANGELYYFASVTTLSMVLYLQPQLSVDIYDNFGAILGTLNFIALSLCTYLFIVGKSRNSNDGDDTKYPILYEFYRGMELHPRIFGVDVKQLTNCRMGMIMWQLFIVIYFVAGNQLHGFNTGHFVNVVLQTVYIYKFFRWETGYFNTLDMTLDRAGYYICWGCLVWIPSFFTFQSYFFVQHPPQSDQSLQFVTFLMGIVSIWCNYEVDLHKETFKTANRSEKIKIWNSPVKFVEVEYQDANGKTRKNRLLASGWWGVARKINYTFELLTAFFWSSVAGLRYGVWPYLYFIFLAVLLIHRIYRDEEKCSKKYGSGWKNYCSKVPYRMIPYVY